MHFYTVVCLTSRLRFKFWLIDCFCLFFFFLFFHWCQVPILTLEVNAKWDHLYCNRLHPHNLHTWSPSWLYAPSISLLGGKGGDISWCVCVVKKRQTNKLETLAPPVKTFHDVLYLVINSHWCCRWGCCALTDLATQLQSLLGETNTKFCNTIPTWCIPTTINTCSRYEAINSSCLMVITQLSRHRVTQARDPVFNSEWLLYTLLLFVAHHYSIIPFISSYVFSLTGCVVGVYGVDVVEIVAYSWQRPCTPFPVG